MSNIQANKKDRIISQVERTAKKGPKAGSKFLGCEKFPDCRFTKKNIIFFRITDNIAR